MIFNFHNLSIALETDCGFSQYSLYVWFSASEMI